MILLMEEILHHLIGSSSTIYKILAPSQVVSIAGFQKTINSKLQNLN